MTKKENFLNICDKAIEQGKGIIVFVKIPGNKEEEVILNSAKDVLNKKEYYDKTYNDDLKHNHAPVEITDIKVEELGLDRVCDSLLINELETRGYTLKKESKLNHIERMDLELEELNDKIVKGQQFLDKEYENPKFTDEVQRYSLEEQLKHMRGYRENLKGRISYDFLKQHKEQ